jgi:hypothetical protein
LAQSVCRPGLDENVLSYNEQDTHGENVEAIQALISNEFAQIFPRMDYSLGSSPEFPPISFRLI